MVYPSVNREAFGLVVAEAMSHGTPVLVPDYGGVTEVMRDGERAGA
ncbi:glycosyltransferase [Azotobacter chroococcum]